MRAVGGTVKGGHIVPDQPLPEGARVEILVPDAQPARSAGADDRPELSRLGLSSLGLSPLEIGRSPFALAADGPEPTPPGPTLPERNGHSKSPIKAPADANGKAAGEARREGDQSGAGDFSWEQAIAQAPPSEWQLARAAQERAVAERIREAEQRERRRTLVIRLVVLLAILAAAGYGYQRVLWNRRHATVKILKRVVKGQTVDLTLGTDAAGSDSMRALAHELAPGGATHLFLIHYGQPKSLLIYDRNGQMLSAIPAASADTSPCSAFVSGPSYSKVTDAIVQRIASEGGEIGDLTRFCGPPGHVDSSDCH